MKQQVTLALSLTLAAGLLAGCADTTGGSQPPGAAQTSPADAIPSAAQSASMRSMPGCMPKVRREWIYSIASVGVISFPP